MAKVFLLIDNNQIEALTDVLSNYQTYNSQKDVHDLVFRVNEYNPDIILIDNSFSNCEILIRQIKSAANNQNIQIILLISDNNNTSCINLADGIIETPVKKNILATTLSSHSKIKKSLDRLSENNKELSRSLYQLNVLYNTSSRFAGTLNTKQLYDIMIEAMEKTLSFDISSLLVINPDNNLVFSLNTLYTPSENLVDALKIRSVLNYRTVLETPSLIPKEKTDNITLIQKIKQERTSKVYGLEAISFDSLFAPIKVGDSFFGVVELFRQIPYSPEDVTCFQAITHQVALPLRSAKLYEEISITNKKLEKLEKLKSEFVSIVSHELRTPLTPINNSLEIVLSEQAGAISPDAKNFISMAKRNIQRLSGIIEDLLDLSRIQAGKLDFQYSSIDITPSLELLQKTFLQVAAQKEIKIVLDIKENLPQVYADIRRIEQIFSNLVSNSLKFTQNQGSIVVSAKVIDESEINYENLVMPIIAPKGKYIQVSVSDNGIGIKKEDIPKIFDKFSQIESSLNRNKGGVGLGLTITKQLIDSHLGAIWVDSIEKEGSVFNVVLPVVDREKIFIMDLSHALINNDNVGVVKIKSKKELNLVEHLKTNKLININHSKQEFDYISNDYSNYFAFIPKISYDSFNALISGINDYCHKIKQDECDIILSNAHSAKNGVDVFNIMKILNSHF